MTQLKFEIKELAFAPQGKKRPAVLTREKKEDKFTLKDSPGADKEKRSDIDNLDSLLANFNYLEYQAIDPAVKEALAKGDKVSATLFNGATVVVSSADIGTDKDKKSFVSIEVSGGDAAAKGKFSAAATVIYLLHTVRLFR